MTTHTQDREECFAVLGSEGWSEEDICELLRLAQIVQRLAVLECNREITDAERLRSERAEEKVRKLAEANHARAKIGGDPRGYCVKLLLRSGRYNTWGGIDCGWGIPAKG